MKTLDLRQHQCPEPVVMTRRELLDNPSSPLTVLVGDDTARENICRLAETMGYGIDVKESGDTLSLELTPGDKVSTAASPQATDRAVLLLTTDTLGQGDDELGSVLMRNYLITLTEMDRTPDTILLLNAGVKLACGGSDALEALEKLADKGIDIAACGLCLEFFSLTDSLRVGRTTNMLEVAGTLQSAPRVIRL